MDALLSLSKSSVQLAACVRKGLITKNVNAFTSKVSRHLRVTLPRDTGV